jgi:O-antigen ligase
MLTYVVICVTAYLVLKIFRAARSADATGYLLVSGLIPLPVYMIGRSVNAGIFPIDVCLLAYLLAHGRSVLGYYVVHRKGLTVGLVALFGFAVLATYSGVFNFLFVDPDPLKFYAFTAVKFWEYALLGAALVASRPDAAQLRKICTIVIAGIAVYEILHALHISGIVPLSGKQYFGPRAEADPQSIVVPFSDRTGWFLASPRVVVGGTASISAWFSLMVFEGYRGTIRAVAAVTAVLSVFSVFATSSRSDIAGLAAAAIVFALCAPPRRWKAYVCAVVAVAGLYAAWLAFFLPPAKETTEITRLSVLWNPGLRAKSSYADRSYDRKSLLRYLPEHPREFLIGVGPGNFRWYEHERVTKNSYGHNSYLHWTGELGIGGFVLLLAWCISVGLYTMNRLRVQNLICRLAACTCLTLLVDRMVAAWGTESLFGTDGMGYYSLFCVGIIYLLASIASGGGAPGFRFHRQRIDSRHSTSSITPYAVEDRTQPQIG